MSIRVTVFPLKQLLLRKDILMDGLGFIAVLPLLIMLIMVVTTKRVFESMLVSLIVVFVLKDGFGFISGFIDGFYLTLAEETYPWILLMLALFGAFISLLINSGGTNGFKKIATRYIKSQKSSLIFTWILGMILFIDDYINNLAIGPTVRDITDQYKVPREGLGFVICSTGTPVCSLVPLTAFAVFVFGVMQDSGVVSADANMLTEYMKVVPFMFYPLMIILVVLLLVLGVIPKVGPFKRYYEELAENTNNKEELRSESITKDDEIPEIEREGKIIDFILPIVSVLGVMLYTSDLVFSVIIGIAVCFVLYIPRKRMTIDKFFANFFEGINDMIYILIVILMTFIFVGALNEIGFSEYVVATISPYLVGGIIPALTFITVGVIAFLGVDYWAVMLLIAPIAIPLAAQFDVSQYLTVAAIASGSVFGGTACLFSEQILMCSQSVQRDPVKVALCGLPYSLMAFTLATILYLIFGFAI